ncbi:MAG: hypothetical protein HYU77_13695 [Betaproteobacteria bacterium]|nr:hypothetical protein [Betaproteobacteria bacterium]
MTKHGDNRKITALIALHDGPMRAKALGERLGVTPERARQIMRELEAEGLVKSCTVTVAGSPPQWEYKLSAVTAGMSQERLRAIAASKRAPGRTGGATPASLTVDLAPVPRKELAAVERPAPERARKTMTFRIPASTLLAAGAMAERSPFRAPKAPAPAPAAPGNGNGFRCALTSAGTLLLIGVVLTDEPLVELDAEQTRALIDYLDRMAEVPHAEA